MRCTGSFNLPGRLEEGGVCDSSCVGWVLGRVEQTSHPLDGILANCVNSHGHTFLAGYSMVIPGIVCGLLAVGHAQGRLCVCRAATGVAMASTQSEYLKQGAVGVAVASTDPTLPLLACGALCGAHRHAPLHHYTDITHNSCTHALSTGLCSTWLKNRKGRNNQ
jgi:hypothetical protein